MQERRRGGGMRLGSSWRWQLTGAMRLSLRWCRVGCPQRAGKGGALLRLWSYSKLLIKSLCFNSLTNSDTLLDCVFEPVYWIVDNVTRWFGTVSDGCFCPLISCPLSSSCSSHSSSCRCSSLWSYCSQPRLWLSSTCSSYRWSSVIILGSGSSGTSAVATGFSPWWSSIITRPPPPPQDTQPRYRLGFLLSVPVYYLKITSLHRQP